MTHTAADLRALVARRVGLKQKVVVLGSDPSLVGALETNGCQVLVDPQSLEQIAAFAPEVIVAFDGFAREGDGAERFAALVRAAPKAALVFSFANAASSSALLRVLVGQGPVLALAEADVRGWLGGAGLQVVGRDMVVGPVQPSGLAVDAEAQLRQLLEQLNPDAGAERLLLVARQNKESSQAPPEPGLLTVIVSATDELSAVEGTLSSLAAQPQRPMQIILVTAGPLEATERLARLWAERGAFAVEVFFVQSPDFAVRTNQALLHARGQYLAFFEAGDTVERHHFRQLIGSLQRGTSAWAVARLKQPGLLYSKSQQAAAFCLPQWLAARATARCALLLDRERLGPFPLTFAEGVAEAEPLFLARLAALFPAITARGIPSIERPTPCEAFDPIALAQTMKARPLRAIGPLMFTPDTLPHPSGLAAQLRRWLKSD